MARRRIEVTGAVQGVGFRPFVYQLASGCGLNGAVWNSTAGVTIEAEGPEAALELFLHQLRSQPPPLARVESTSVQTIAANGGAGFHILPSRSLSAVPAQIAPDTAPCPHCHEDYLDAHNRRHGYAFTNCTHCGPRYTITRGVPYDRPLTTMAAFPMCAQCQQEYDSPLDRRFHAQPNACPACGPQLSCSLDATAARLRAGNIVAIKNVGGFQLACDPANESTVARLRAAKNRPRKPFALLAADLAAVAQICHLSDIERTALESSARPIVLLRRRDPASPKICPSAAPGQLRLGIMLPSSPLHDLLLAAYGKPFLLMTSGNRGSEPLAASASEAHANLTGIADCFLDHSRPIHARADDSVAFVAAGRLHLLRRARGYVPQPLALTPVPCPAALAILAAGAELKNTFCLTRGSQAFLSPHTGDMANPPVWSFYEQTLKHYLTLLSVRPKVLALDAHPGYLLNQWVRTLAPQLGIGRIIAVQHHHAHIAACMAEYQLEGDVLGVAWDGTGYGSDGAIWGGEFLLASRSVFRRLAHLPEILLPGGEAAIRQPWRLGLAYLYRELGDAALPIARQLWPNLAPKRLEMVWTLLHRPSLCVPCTSAGRLFDAAAAILGLFPETEEVTFEADPAMRVETAALACPLAPVPWPLASLFTSLAAARTRGERIELLAARLHATLAAAITATCRTLRDAGAGDRVCLGGGVFQNQILLSATLQSLESSGFHVFVPQQVPMNDGGLSLGQAAIAQAIESHPCA
ncbi:MAG: carbamoyltransferase HypF [Acidobacteria bacterium]|nr:MAG: carbamoyltransferase HypF [Acidobacteriota bacterium]